VSDSIHEWAIIIRWEDLSAQTRPLQPLDMMRHVNSTILWFLCCLTDLSPAIGKAVKTPQHLSHAFILAGRDSLPLRVQLPVSYKGLHVVTEIFANPIIPDCVMESMPYKPDPKASMTASGSRTSSSQCGSGLVKKFSQKP
jgi:hypothetical protein